MCNGSMSPKKSLDVRTRALRILAAAGGVLALSLPAAAQTPTGPLCGAEVKEEIVKALEGSERLSAQDKEALENELYLKYKSCGEEAHLAPQSFFEAARQCGAAVSNLGSIFFEEMSCAGYDPQRRQFAAPIKIKQVVGYGFAQLPGSREHVLHCVADAAGILRPVGHDSVHLANAIGNQNPTWQFAVIANANDNLQTIQPMNGATRRARSIMSWALPPTNCNYTPIWGNALNYRIRLDQ